jgi:hypothetical protein
MRKKKGRWAAEAHRPFGCKEEGAQLGFTSLEDTNDTQARYWVLSTGSFPPPACAGASGLRLQAAALASRRSMDGGHWPAWFALSHARQRKASCQPAPHGPHGRIPSEPFGFRISHHCGASRAHPPCSPCPPRAHLEAGHGKHTRSVRREQGFSMFAEPSPGWARRLVTARGLRRPQSTPTVIASCRSSRNTTLIREPRPRSRRFPVGPHCERPQKTEAAHFFPRTQTRHLVADGAATCVLPLAENAHLPRA